MTGPVDRGLQRIMDAVDPDALGEAIAEVIVASIPEIGDRGDEDLRLAIIANATRSVGEVLESLRRGEREDFTPPDPAIAFAHALVHRGIDLAALLRSYRLGHAVAEERLREIAADELDLDPEVRFEALSRASRVFFRYVDAICSQLTDTYAQERERWVRGAAAARAECVAAVLAGEVVDPADATRVLDHDVAGRGVAFIVWSDPREMGAVGAAELEVAASALAGDLGGGPPLVVGVGDSAVWAWTAGEGVTDRPPDGRAVPRGVRAAVGTPREGLDGFVRSHREAQRARRAAGLLGRRPGTVTRHEAVALVALTTAEPEAAASFVEHELGELAAPTDAMARLRATVRAYCEENASPVRTARRLGVHQNTIVYRVNRAEELLGRSIADRRLELEVALRLADAVDALRAAAPGP